MKDNIINLEDEFLEDVTKTGRFIMSIGIKGGGKSFAMLNFLKYALSNEIFESYHLVLPMYKLEQSDSYGFLRNQKQCYIYNGYSEKVSKNVEKERAKKKTLFIIDDASAELLYNLDSTFSRLITTSRHGKGVTVWICVHSAKRILTPLVRQNVDWMFVYKISNVKLLQDIYDEWLSMQFETFKEFMQYYRYAMQTKYNSVLLTNQVDSVDLDVVEWETLPSYEDVELKPHKGNGINKFEPKKKKPEEKPKSTPISFFSKKRRL